MSCNKKSAVSRDSTGHDDVNKKIEKITTIINREFQNEINDKRNRLNIIDERLLEARKIFYRLRYAVVHEFYNTKKFELTEDDLQKEISNQKDPNSKSETYSLLTNSQKRIHPSVKDALSERYSDDISELSTQRLLRKRAKLDESKSLENEENSCNKKESKTTLLSCEIGDINNVESDSKPFIDQSDSFINKPVTIPMYVEPKKSEDNVLKIDFASRNKQREKVRIIIGNTSKSIEPHSARDRITHKWLLYVRGPPGNPDISFIVDSIVVQLHDSYIPHNIVKMKSPPFHLPRRGWGEFPVKLKIHFKNEKFNKSINVVHNLKLDRNRTGRETLGGETVVDVWLYTDRNIKNSFNSEDDKINSVDNKDGWELDSVIEEMKYSNMIDLDNTFREKSSVSEEVINNFECKKENTETYDDSLIKIKDEPIDVNDEIDENNYENIFIENENAFCNETNDSTLNFNFDNSIFDSTCNKLNNFNLDESDCKSNNYGGLENIFKCNLSEDMDVENNSHMYDFVKHKILQHIKDDHCYAMRQENKWNDTEVLKYNKCSVEVKAISEIFKNVELQQIVDWFNSFDLNINSNDNFTFGVCELIELNKSVLDKIVNFNLILSKKKMFNIQNIATINKIVLSCYLKELSVSLWKPSKRNLKEIQKFIKILKEINSVNEKYSNIQSALMKNLHAKPTENDKNNGINAVKSVLSILEDLISNMSKINNMRCFVNKMLSKMPLIHEYAKVVEFQQLFPYVVESSEVYFSLKKIKKRHLQWTRAKMIHEFVKNFCCNKFPKVWSTKQILIFTQYHGYYPVKNINDDVNYFNNHISTNEKFENSCDINTKTIYQNCDFSYNKMMVADKASSSNIKSEIASYDFCYISDSSDDEVEVCENMETNSKTKKCVDTDNIKTSPIKMENEILPFENEDEKILCRYIENVCSDLGIVLANQNIGHGYVFGMVQKLILSALKNFIEDILRRSLAVKMSAVNSCSVDKLKMCNDATEESDNQVQNNSNASSEDNKIKIWEASESLIPTNVSLRHIFEALKSRREFDFLTNFGLGLETSNYVGEL